jgi:hypothetical protein
METMKKEISLGQVLAISIALLTSLITGWVTITNKMTDQNRRIQNIEMQQEKQQNQIEQITARLEDKVDHIRDELIQVRLLLENKENRK